MKVEWSPRGRRIFRWVIFVLVVLYAFLGYITFVYEPGEGESAVAAQGVDERARRETKTAPSPIGDTALPGGLDVESLSTPFNKTAGEIGFPVRIALESCKQEKRRGCTYSAGGGLSLIAGSTPDMKTLGSLSILLETSGAAAAAAAGGIKLIGMVGVIMAIVSPNADLDERGAALSNLLGELGKKDKLTAEIVFRAVKYQIVVVPGLAVMGHIAPID